MTNLSKVPDPYCIVIVKDFFLLEGATTDLVVPSVGSLFLSIKKNLLFENISLIFY